MSGCHHASRTVAVRSTQSLFSGLHVLSLVLVTILFFCEQAQANTFTTNAGLRTAMNKIDNCLQKPDACPTFDRNTWYVDETQISISEWDVKEVKSFDRVFENQKELVPDISKWDVSAATSTNHMFHNAILFDSDLSKWDVARVKNIDGMFRNAVSFVGSRFVNGTTDNGLAKWNVAAVTSMKFTFQRAKSFNSDLSDWNVQATSNMFSTFWGAESFNSDISLWDVSNVKDMGATFVSATHFNSDISEWQVGSVLNMGLMFTDALVFNADVSKWDVSRVGMMHSMFSGALSFNSELATWDVSNVVFMNSMFRRAYSFNQDVRDWNVLSVNNFDNMFKDAIAFKMTFASAADMVTTMARTKQRDQKYEEKIAAQQLLKLLNITLPEITKDSISLAGLVSFDGKSLHEVWQRKNRKMFPGLNMFKDSCALDSSCGFCSRRNTRGEGACIAHPQFSVEVELSAASETNAVVPRKPCAKCAVDKIECCNTSHWLTCFGFPECPPIRPLKPDPNSNTCADVLCTLDECCAPAPTNSTKSSAHKTYQSSKLSLALLLVSMWLMSDSF